MCRKSRRISEIPRGNDQIPATWQTSRRTCRYSVAKKKRSQAGTAAGMLARAVGLRFCALGHAFWGCRIESRNFDFEFSADFHNKAQNLTASAQSRAGLPLHAEMSWGKVPSMQT